MKSRDESNGPAWPLLIGLFFLAATVGYPIVILLLQSIWPELLGGSFDGFLDAYARLWNTPGLAQMLWNSLLWGLCTTLGAWILGVPCGWLLARTDLPFKNVARTLLLVPVMSPAYVNALAYVLTMQPGGFADMVLAGAGGLPAGIRAIFFSFWGVTFVMVMASFGGVALAIEASLRAVPGRLEDAAASLGARWWQILRLITLPLVLPALINSGILVFLDAISNFGVPAIMGPRANLPLLPAEIYQLATSWPLDFPLATALSALLCLAAIALVSFGRSLMGKHPLGRTRSAAPKVHALGPTGIAAGWGWIGGLFIFSGILPNTVVVATSFIDRWNGGHLQLTTRHYADLFRADSGSFQALTTSLGLSFVTATATVIVGALTAYGIARHRGALAETANMASLVPRIIPRIVTAIAFIMAWNAPWIGLEIYNTLWILLLAYFAFYQTDAIRFADSGMRQIGINLEQAASVLGARRWQIFLKVVLPLLAPALFAAWITTFVVCMRDWVASIILLPPGFQTIGSFIFNQFDQGNLSAAMAMTACTVLVSTGVLVALQLKRRS